MKDFFVPFFIAFVVAAIVVFVGVKIGNSIVDYIKEQDQELAQKCKDWYGVSYALVNKYTCIDREGNTKPLPLSI